MRGVLVNAFNEKFLASYQLAIEHIEEIITVDEPMPLFITLFLKSAWHIFIVRDSSQSNQIDRKI